MKKLTFISGLNGLPSNIAQASSYVDARVLDNLNTAETVTVPAGAKSVVFSTTGNFYANFNGGTAVAPVADVTDGSASEVNPIAVGLFNIATFSIVAANLTAQTVTMKFFG